MNKGQFNTLKKQCLYIMENHIEARNCDKILTARIWSKFYPDYLVDGCIKVNAIFELPFPPSITRARRKIQNTEGLFLPTKNVHKRRTKEQANWTGALGYPISVNRVTSQMEF